MATTDGCLRPRQRCWDTLRPSFSREPLLNADPLSSRLMPGLKGLGVSLPDSDRQRFIAYVRLLAKWNNAYNLTAVRDPEEMITRHVLDSLTLLPYLHGQRQLDIGSGAGLPGIPLAVARPDLSFTLIDANAKKIRFIVQTIGELDLKNVDAVQARVENYRPALKFDTLMSRAFASIADMLTHTRHLCAPDGRFLAMKGMNPREELTALPAGYAVREVVALQVPGLDAARHVAIITPQ